MDETEVGVLEGRNRVRDCVWQEGYPVPNPQQDPCDITPILQVGKLRQEGQSPVLGPRDQQRQRGTEAPVGVTPEPGTLDMREGCAHRRMVAVHVTRKRSICSSVRTGPLPGEDRVFPFLS